MMTGMGRIGAPVAPQKVAIGQAPRPSRPACVTHATNPRPSRRACVARATNKAWGPGPGKMIAATQSVDELASLELDTLREWLSDLVRDEEYAVAAKVRDAIRKVEMTDPLRSCELELERAVREERYGDAALLRDQLKELMPPPPPPPEPPMTTSSKLTEGIRVTVESFYVPAQSRPAANSFLFAYKIKITNESHPTTVKLVARRWIITDANGRQREVQGPGVVGEFPELGPGDSFEYQSGCPLATKEGTMSGEYEFYSRVSPSDSWNTSFLVYIAEFGLSIDGPKMT